MKTTLFLFVLILLTSLNGSAQEEEYFVYCSDMSSDTAVISKISEYQIGDTIIREYTGINNTFKYYIFNDTIFSKYQDEYVMIGANQAEIGDVWHPIWYSINSYNYSEFDHNPGNCSLRRSLKVVDIDTINLNGQDLKKYSLLVMDEVPFYDYTDSILFSFIEGVGATVGGPYYNLYYEGNCVMMFDLPTITFRAYGTDEFYYLEADCSGNVGVNEIENAIYPIVYVNNGELIIKSKQDWEISSLVDLSGKVVYSSDGKNTIHVDHLKGLYFAVMENKDGKVYQAKVVL